jgi:hypothetical protein
MLPDSAYPVPLPLNRATALDLLSRLAEYEAARGAFLTFVELPVEERIGEWRFAGASGSLAEAVRQVGHFGRAMGMPDPDAFLGWLLEENQDSGHEHEYSYPRTPPRIVSGPHRLILSVRNAAPYEGIGVAIVEVESLAGSSFAGFGPETHPLQSPDDDDPEDAE